MTTSFTPQPFTAMTPLAQQEMAKWQMDRERWEEALPVMHWLSQFLELTPVTSDNANLASTDGRELYFCPKLSATLSDEERIFLQAHLIWHCVAGHLSAPLVAFPHRWHLACDHEVNSLLFQLGMSLPSEAMLFPTCFGLSAMPVYRWLSGHPCPEKETSLDIHPAELWAHVPGCFPDVGLIGLWRRRAHVAVRMSPALPTMVAEFCASR